jgi:N-acetylneuraminate lyase
LTMNPADYPLNGLIAAPFTPFHTDGALNVSVIEKQAEHFVRDGVAGVFVCGTSGEGASMTVDERKSVAARWKEVAGDDLPVIVHVGHNCQRDAVSLARHAAQVGAYGVAACAPSFFKPPTALELAIFLAPIAGGAPDLPFYYYHIPSFTGGTLRASDVLEHASKLIPNCAGVKFTHDDLADYKRCLEFANGRYSALFGRDELLLDALELGAKGAIGSTYNFAAPLYHALIRSFEIGDAQTARRLQDLATRSVEIIFAANGGLPAAKALMTFLGIDCGPVRSPLRSFPKADMDQMLIELAQIDFFNLLN